jgi:PhnB protein
MAKKAKKSARRQPAARKSASRRSSGRSAARSKRSGSSAAGAARTTAASRAPGAPAGMHTVTAQLTLRDSARAIEFYKQAFGAQEVMRMPTPDGRGIWHAEIRIGDSVMFLSDEMGQGPTAAPSATQKATAVIQLYVPDCDAVFQAAVQAGARVNMPLADMFWGDRYGSVTDPFGQVWGVATHVKVPTPDEIRRGAEEFAAKMRSAAPQSHAS